MPEYPYSSSNSPAYISITSTIYKITIYLQTALLRLYNPNIYPRSGERVVSSISQVKADEKAVRNCLHHLQLHAWKNQACEMSFSIRQWQQMSHCHCYWLYTANKPITRCLPWRRDHLHPQLSSYQNSSKVNTDRLVESYTLYDYMNEMEAHNTIENTHLFLSFHQMWGWWVVSSQRCLQSRCCQIIFYLSIFSLHQHLLLPSFLLTFLDDSTAAIVTQLHSRFGENTIDRDVFSTWCSESLHTLM